jgi:hypothetical protein
MSNASTLVQRGEGSAMKILGYCTLWIIAAALLVLMCAIVQDSVICHEIAVGSPVAGSTKLAGRLGSG